MAQSEKRSHLSTWFENIIRCGSDELKTLVKVRWPVASLDRAVGWYCNVLGFSVSHQWIIDVEPIERVVRLRLGGLCIELIELTGHCRSVVLKTRYPLTDTGFCLPVPILDMNGCICRAKKRGHCDVAGPLIDYADHTKFCFIQTIDNHSIKLIQMLNAPTS